MRDARSASRERVVEADAARQSTILGLRESVEDLKNALGKRERGEKVTREQVILAVAGFLLYDVDGKLVIAPEVHSDKDRYNVAAQLSGLSPNTAKKYVELFREAGVVVLEVPGARGPAKHDAAELDALDEPVKEWVRKTLSDKEEPMWITRKLIQDFIYQTSGVFASFTRITKLCKAWGLSYGRLERAPTTHDPLRFLLRRVALLEYSHHVRLGNMVMEMDESYDNARKALTHSFHIDGSPFAAFARQQGAGTGPRLCWAQAFGKKGYGVFPGTPRPDLGDIKTVTPTCEMMFMANANVGDYHDNFNHEVFKDWLNNRFIPFVIKTDPAVLTGVPGARLAAGSGWILRLDNAPYHCVTTTNLNPAMGNIRFDPRKVTKIVLIDALQALGCVSLDVNHTYRVAEGDLESEDGEPERDADDNVVVDDEGFVTVQLKITIDINDAEKAKRAKMGSHPSVPEIQIAAYEWCVYNRPSALENDCEYILRTKLNGNCKPSWNSPNFPESMTCETTWCTVKMYNSCCSTPRRTPRELWQHTGEGMYTDKVAAPATHNYKGGKFLAGADGKCPEAEKYIKHTWDSPKGGCAMQIAQDDEARAGGFTDMKDGVCPQDMVEMRDAPNRAVLRFLAAKYLMARQQGAMGEHLDEAEMAEEDDGAEEG